MAQDPPDLELQAVESALRGLVPVAGRLNRDRLMYQAGVSCARAAARRRWASPTVAAALAAALVAETLFVVNRPSLRVVDQVVTRRDAGLRDDSPPASSSGVAPREPAAQQIRSSAAGDSLALAAWRPSSDYQRLQNLVLRFGVDALAERPAERSTAGVSAGGDHDHAQIESVGALRRAEIDKYLPSGGSS